MVKLAPDIFLNGYHLVLRTTVDFGLQDCYENLFMQFSTALCVWRSDRSALQIESTDPPVHLSTRATATNEEKGARSVLPRREEARRGKWSTSESDREKRWNSENKQQLRWKWNAEGAERLRVLLHAQDFSAARRTFRGRGR